MMLLKKVTWCWNMKINLQIDLNLIKAFTDDEKDKSKVSILAVKNNKTQDKQPDYRLLKNYNGKWYEVGAGWIKEDKKVDNVVINNEKIEKTIQFNEF